MDEGFAYSTIDNVHYKPTSGYQSICFVENFVSSVWVGIMDFAPSTN
jgi:hypothetical protein